MSEDDDFQLTFQQSRLLRTVHKSLLRSLESPPWRDLITVDASSFDPDAADMTIGPGGVRAPNLPRFAIRDKLDGLGKRLAESLAGFLAHRQDLLRRAAVLAANHHADFLDGNATQGAPPDAAAIHWEVGCSSDELDIYLRGKTIDTPRGRSDFQSLFRHPPVTPSAGDLVRQMVAQIIAAESPDAPLSDDEVLAALALRDVIVTPSPGEGHPIARFRRMLGIPTATERKR